LKGSKINLHKKADTNKSEKKLMRWIIVGMNHGKSGINSSFLKIDTIHKLKKNKPLTAASFIYAKNNNQKNFRITKCRI
jgi:hypothetical protein